MEQVKYLCRNKDRLEFEMVELITILKIMLSNSMSYYWDGRSKYGIIDDHLGNRYKIPYRLYDDIRSNLGV